MEIDNNIFYEIRYIISGAPDLKKIYTFIPTFFKSIINDRKLSFL